MIVSYFHIYPEYGVNLKLLQKDLLFCFCKILSSGSEQSITLLLYALPQRHLHLHSTSSCSCSQQQVHRIYPRIILPGPRPMWRSLSLLWKFCIHSYFEHFHCQDPFSKTVVTNKLFYEGLKKFVALILDTSSLQS